MGHQWWQWSASIKVDSQADSPAHPASIMPPRPWLTNALKRSQEWHDRLARSNAISLRHGSKPQVQCKTFFCGTASAQTQMSKYAKRKVSKEAGLRRPVPVVDRRIFCQVYQAGAALYGSAAGKGGSSGATPGGTSRQAPPSARTRPQCRPARQDAFDVRCQSEIFGTLRWPMVPESA